MRASAAAFALLGALLLAACGGSGDDHERGDAGRRPVTLALDYVPNAVHAGIYCAREHGDYAKRGIDLRIVEPASTSDTLSLIDRGEVDFGIADPVDVALQIDRGRPAQAIMALVQRPLGGLIARRDSSIHRPRDLEGGTVGVTGVASDEVVLDAVVGGDGGDPSRVDLETVGFNGAQALAAGRLDAFTGFLIADGTALEQKGVPVRGFALDRFGGPRYPGLVVFSTPDAIDADPALTRDFVRATLAGYRETVANPRRCLRALVRRAHGVDQRLARAQLDGYLPLFRENLDRDGRVSAAAVEELSRFLEQGELISSPISAHRYAWEGDGG